MIVKKKMILVIFWNVLILKLGQISIVSKIRTNKHIFVLFFVIANN